LRGFYTQEIAYTGEVQSGSFASRVTKKGRRKKLFRRPEEETGNEAPQGNHVPYKHELSGAVDQYTEPLLKPSFTYKTYKYTRNISGKFILVNKK
jgi:hypothetical protein